MHQTLSAVQATQQRKLRVGLCGAGLGGLAAAIAIARAGCEVRILEAASELGEVKSQRQPKCGPRVTFLC